VRRIQNDQKSLAAKSGGPLSGAYNALAHLPVGQAREMAKSGGEEREQKWRKLLGGWTPR